MAEVVSRQHLQISKEHYEGGQRDQTETRVLGASGMVFVCTEIVTEYSSCRSVWRPDEYTVCMPQKQAC
jgi:hypothetical protein